MKELLKSKLVDRFAERVAFQASSREQYARDVVQTGRAGPTILPDAIVYPTAPRDVVFLARFAAAHHIPLVPRGAATSSYGGTLPIQGGIVVDFTRMNRVLGMDPQHPIIAVEPGVTWQEVDWALRDRGLALRVYPSSGAMSTVGGWLAAGGVGIGSYQYGPINRNVSWVDLVLPNGRQVRIDGESLAQVLGTQGITGMIVGAGLPARAVACEDLVMVASFSRLRYFFQFLQNVRELHLPLWHVSLISAALDARPDHATVPLAGGEAIELPVSRHTAILAAPDQRHGDLRGQFRRHILACGGALRPGKLALSFWHERWQRGGLGLLGPATANGAVMMPLSRLDLVFQEARRQGLPTRLVANLAGRGWTAVRCLPTGEGALRPAVAQQWLALARQHGAHPFGFDLWEHEQAKDCVAPDLYEWLLTFKRRQDPHNLMNPGKLLAQHLARGAAPVPVGG